MSKYIEQFKSGWMLTLMRYNPNLWLFTDPSANVLANGVDDAMTKNAVDFKDIRPLLAQSKVVVNSGDADGSFGLPLVSIYVHKDVGV